MVIFNRMLCVSLIVWLYCCILKVILIDVITLPAGEVAKYCDEYVCLCVCLSVSLAVREDMSDTTRGMFTKLFVHVAYVRGSVLLRHVYDRPHRLWVGREWWECTARVKCNLLLCVCVCSTVLMLLKMVVEYCHLTSDIPSTAPEILNRLIELLKVWYCVVFLISKN